MGTVLYAIRRAARTVCPPLLPPPHPASHPRQPQTWQGCAGDGGGGGWAGCCIGSCRRACLAPRPTDLVDGGKDGGDDPGLEHTTRRTELGAVDVDEELGKRALGLFEQGRLRVFLDVHGDEVEDGGDPGGVLARVDTLEGCFAILPGRGGATGRVGERAEGGGGVG